MYLIGDKEVEALAEVIRSGKLFRYGVGNQCDTFERRYAAFLGVEHVSLTASGTNALTAAITAMGIGPGHEVLVPSHTYMATPIAVVSAGAIPVIVDIDETLTIDPQAADEAVGPRTMEQLVGSLRALDVELDESTLTKLDEIFPGPRGEAPQAYAW